MYGISERTSGLYLKVTNEDAHKNVFNGCIKGEFFSFHIREPVKKELVNFTSLQSLSFKLLRRVYLSPLNTGQWRRNESLI